MTDCPFCALFQGRGSAPERLIWPRGREWGYDLGRSGIAAFEPLNPVTPGHMLVVPTKHVEDAAASPEIAGQVVEVAAALLPRPFNLITSAGAAATQTVKHLHVHVVPRHPGDGLHLPWTGQVTA